MMRLIHSCPTWMLGPKTADSKFGGSQPIAGIPKVIDRLKAIKKAFPDDLTSLHLVHEVKTDLCQDSKPNAISWEDLIFGIDIGNSPRIAAIIAPAFGFLDVESGFILSADTSIRQLARDLHLEAIEKSQELLS